MKRILWWGLSACIILPGVVLGGMAALDHARAYAAYKSFGGLDPEQRAGRLLKIGYKRDWRLAGLVQQALSSPQSREELQAAGYAAMRVGRQDFLPVLQEHADREPDDYTRAMLMVYAARLSDRDTRQVDWLAAGLQSGRPWRQAGAAAGLMHVGRAESGTELIKAARSGDAEVAAFALGELAWTTRSMAQAIGRPLAFLEQDPLPADALYVDQIEKFWNEFVTTDLLNDVLRRLTVRDRDWAEMGRLIHARNKVARLMQ